MAAVELPKDLYVLLNYSVGMIRVIPFPGLRGKATKFFENTLI